MRAFIVNGREEDDQRLPSSFGAVCEKGIISTTGDLVFFFSIMTHKKVEHLTPSREAEVGHLPQPQREKRSLPHNAVTVRPLQAADAPPPEDRVLSNSPNPLRESLNSPEMWTKFHVLLEMMKSL
ncbi:hypothetical protein ACLOJK_001228 [Asimina triloba]